MTPETAIVDVLAVCRLTRLVTKDTLLDVPRDALLERLEDSGKAGRKAAEGLECPWCASVYLAFGVLVLRRLFPRQWHPVAKALAASHLAGFAANIDID